MRKKTNRESLLMALYQYDMNQDMNEKESITIDDLSEEETFSKIVASLPKIDQTIEDALTEYSLKRLSYVDRAIIRIAAYEVLFTELPEAIIIHEAIVLTKKYSDLDDEKQHKFNHRVLDNICKNSRG